MITISVANQKGGVGKTTTAIALSIAFPIRGKRVPGAIPIHMNGRRLTPTANKYDLDVIGSTLLLGIGLNPHA